MKIRSRELSDKERMHTLDALYTAASSLRGREQMKLFLRDLLTESERIMCGRRILIARQLIEGKTYEEIQSSMSVGVGTISKIQRWLADQMPGYEQAIEGMKKSLSKRESKAEASRMWSLLKRKYPLHFLFFQKW